MALAKTIKKGNTVIEIYDDYCAHLTPDSPEVKERLKRCAEIYMRAYNAKLARDEKKSDT